jgi:hypothetical protein
VRWPGKSSGAFAFALILLVLFASRRKEQQSAQKRNKDQIINPSIVTPAKAKWKQKDKPEKQEMKLSYHPQKETPFTNSSGLLVKKGSYFFIHRLLKVNVSYR